MGLKAGHRSEYGKPSASKEARSVWNGGKAARPYLSLHCEPRNEAKTRIFRRFLLYLLARTKHDPTEERGHWQMNVLGMYPLLIEQ